MRSRCSDRFRMQPEIQRASEERKTSPLDWSNAQLGAFNGKNGHSDSQLASAVAAGRKRPAFRDPWTGVVQNRRPEPSTCLPAELRAMNSTTLRGGCLCGGVRYEIEGPFQPPEHCHCGMCRKAHGAAFSTNAVVAAANLRVVCGSDLLTEYESSPNRRKCFCSRCGSQLFIRRQNRPTSSSSRWGRWMMIRR